MGTNLAWGLIVAALGLVVWDSVRQAWERRHRPHPLNILPMPRHFNVLGRRPYDWSTDCPEDFG